MYYTYMTRVKATEPIELGSILRRKDGVHLPKNVESTILIQNKFFIMMPLYSNIPYDGMYASTTEEPFAYDISIGPFESLDDAKMWEEFFTNIGLKDSDTYFFKEKERSDEVIYNKLIPDTEKIIDFMCEGEIEKCKAEIFRLKAPL